MLCSLFRAHANDVTPLRNWSIDTKQIHWHERKYFFKWTVTRELTTWVNINWPTTSNLVLIKNVRKDVDSTDQNEPIIETTTSQDKEAVIIEEDKPFHPSDDFGFSKRKLGEKTTSSPGQLVLTIRMVALWWAVSGFDFYLLASSFHIDAPLWSHSDVKQ